MSACPVHEHLHAFDERSGRDWFGEEGVEARVEGALAVRRLDVGSGGNGRDVTAVICR